MLLLVAMVLSFLPSAVAEQAVQYGYIVIKNNTKDRTVFLRPAPGSTDYVDKLPEWLVVEWFSTKTSGGKTYYYARNPQTNDVGYIQGDFLQTMTAEQVTAWLASNSPYYYGGGTTTTPTDPSKPDESTDPTTPDESTDPGQLPNAGDVLGFIRLTVNNVNLRETPNGKILTEKDEDKLPVGLVLPYYNIVTAAGYNWAQVNYDGQVVYIRSDCYGFCDMDGNLVTGAPGVVGTPTPTPTPGAAVTDIPAGSYGFTTMDNVMFRKEMTINGDYWARLPRNWRVEVLGAETKGGVLWYKVTSGTPANPTRTYTGYIHSGYLTVYTGSSATNAPTSAPSTYAVIMVDGTNLRQTPGGESVSALPKGTVVNVFSKPAGNSANDWYYVGLPLDGSYKYGYLPATSLWVIPESELGNYGTLPATPAPTASPSPTPSFTGSGYIKLILNNVNIRKTPAGTSLTPKDSDKMPIGTVLAYTEGPTYVSGYNWVKVTYKGITGYVRSDCYEFCDANGNPIVPQATATPEPGATAQPGQMYIRLVKSEVNLRYTPWGDSQGRLSKGTILPYTSTRIAPSDGTLWYYVYSSKLNAYGYILSTMAVTCDANGNEVAAPSVTPAPTNTPGSSGGPATAPDYTGYIATSLTSVWVRSAPDVNASTVGQIKNKGTVLPLTGVAIWNNPYTWYPVTLDNGVRGYIRGDCAYQLAQWQLDAFNKTGVVPTPTPGPATPKPGNSEYVIVTGSGKLWVRETPSTKAGTLGQYTPGTILKFYEKKVSGNVTWYRVVAPKGGYGWIHGSYARILTNAEYEQSKPTAAPTAQPTAMPDPSTFSDVAFTTADRVKIRATGSMSGKELTMVYTAGTKLTYLGKYTVPTVGNEWYWFNVQYQGYTGWMRGDYIRILTKAEKQLYEQTGNPDAPPEASYTTLSKGSTGEAVTRLQQKLAEKGYLTAAQVTGTYDTDTENAVRAFQKDNNLTVDGIAGEKTQHKLFNTVPEGTYSEGSVTPNIFPVEMIDWYSGGIQNIWSVGTVAIITDVYTGISFRAQRLYGDNHADCEPQTSADTEAYCRIFKVSTAQEIADRQQALEAWRRRPLWVTIGNRTFAASLYGVPHNYEGDRIPNNNFTGQFCVHFVNSRTHESNVVDTDRAANGYYGHQSAIRDAYNYYYNNYAK